MQFVDAHGQWYEFTPNDNVKKHDYDLSAFKNVDGKMTYSDGKYKSRAGIDVSEFNGDIDWNAVKNAGVEFAFIRIGGRGYGQSGNLYADKKFDDNYKGAKAAGLDVGCYFFSQAINEEEAKEEAKYVLDILKGRSLDLPIVYDPESILKDEARTDNVSGEQFTKNCVAFFDYIKNENNVSNYSYTTMIYCNMVWEAFMLDLVKLKDYDIWYADYEPLPQTPYHFSIWQYSESGTISGITGNVDLNIQIIVDK
ncbi:MAG: glycoside hydrolase family 25 protein [Lachnospiraceae bacterium]|nr:glycoside hydrolase family 25 protein [Lachnospiraceae bacterium]